MSGPTEGSITAAWRALRGAGDEVRWRHIPIGMVGTATVAAGMMFPDRREALIVTFPDLTIPDAHSLPKASGFECTGIPSNSESPDDRIDSIALVRAEGAEIAMFELMTVDILAHLSRHAGLPLRGILGSFLSRVREWQEFMAAGVDRPLSLDRQTGLFGELLLVETLLSSGLPARQVISGWLGPLRAAQDFRFGNHAVEVKSFAGQSGFPARISGLDQLDNPDGPLHLVAWRLEVSESGRSLPELVTALRIRMGSEPVAKSFDARLTCAGWNDAHAAAYARVLASAGITVLPVEPGFPRLIRSGVPSAMLSATYVLDLDLIEAPKLELDAMISMIAGSVGWI